MMVVDVTASGDTFQASVPRELFTSRNLKRMAGWQYDTTPDGQRFLANVVTEEARVEPLTLVQNWPERLERRSRR